jgi:hypothetical protein
MAVAANTLNFKDGAETSVTVVANPALGGADITVGISTTDVTTGNVTSAKHGFAPKAPADAATFLNGAATPAYAQVKDSDLSTSDVTTNNVSSSKHGFAPKGDGTTTKFLNANGAYSTPAGDPASATQAWLPLTTVVGGVPDLVWSGADSLIATLATL